MGFNTHFTWKGITLSAVLDWRNGGEFYSYTSQLLTFAGNSTYTVFNNREPFVVPNSVKVVNGQYVENDIPIVIGEVLLALLIPTIITPPTTLSIEIGFYLKIT